MKTIEPLKLFTTDEVNQMCDENIPWRVAGLIPEVGASIVAAQPKTGKSVLCRQLAVHLAMGWPFLGREVRQCRTLIIATQESPERIVQHFRELCCDEAKFPLVADTLKLEPHQALEMLDRTLRQHPDIRVVVLDMIVDLVASEDFNDYKKMAETMRALRPLAQNHKVQILGVHHSGKVRRDSVVGSLIGSTMISASVDQIILLDSDMQGSRTIVTAQRYGESLPTTRLGWDTERRAFSMGNTVEAERIAQQSDTKDRIRCETVKYLNRYPGRTREEVLVAVTGKAALKRAVFNELLNEGLFKKSGTGQKGDPFLYENAHIDFTKAA